MTKDPIRLLIVLMGSVGDVARGLVVVDKLKTHFEQIHITWLVEPTCAPIVKLHKKIDEVIIFERKAGLRGVKQLRHELRSRNYDITLDLQRHFKSGFFSWLSGAKRRIGFNRVDCKEFNWMFNNEQIAPFAQDQPKLLHYLKFVEYLGCDVTAPYSFGIEEIETSALIPANSIGIVLGSRWKSKDWQIEGYQRLLLSVFDRTDMNVVLLGDKSQVGVAEKLQLACAHKCLFNLCGKTSLAELVAALKSCRVCIGPDSGPGHLAAAVKTPYVTLFGPTDPNRVAPYQALEYVVRAKIGCSPCNRKVCPGLNTLCMRLIPVEEVFSTLQRALNFSAAA